MREKGKLIWRGGGWGGWGVGVERRGGNESFLPTKSSSFSFPLVIVTFLLYRLRGNEANPTVREITNDGANFVYFEYYVGLCIVSPARMSNASSKCLSNLMPDPETTHSQTVTTLKRKTRRSLQWNLWIHDSLFCKYWNRRKAKRDTEKRTTTNDAFFRAPRFHREIIFPFFPLLWVTPHFTLPPSYPCKRKGKYTNNHCLISDNGETACFPRREMAKFVRQIAAHWRIFQTSHHRFPNFSPLFLFSLFFRPLFLGLTFPGRFLWKCRIRRENEDIKNQTRTIYKKNHCNFVGNWMSRTKQNIFGLSPLSHIPNRFQTLNPFPLAPKILHSPSFSFPMPTPRFLLLLLLLLLRPKAAHPARKCIWPKLPSPPLSFPHTFAKEKVGRFFKTCSEQRDCPLLPCVHALPDKGKGEERRGGTHTKEIWDQSFLSFSFEICEVEAGIFFFERKKIGKASGRTDFFSLSRCKNGKSGGGEDFLRKMTRPLFFYFASLLLANGTFLPGKKKDCMGALFSRKNAWKKCKGRTERGNFRLLCILFFSFQNRRRKQKLTKKRRNGNRGKR